MHSKSHVRTSSDFKRGKTKQAYNEREGYVRELALQNGYDILQFAVYENARLAVRTVQRTLYCMPYCNTNCAVFDTTIRTVLHSIQHKLYGIPYSNTCSTVYHTTAHTAACRAL